VFADIQDSTPKSAFDFIAMKGASEYSPKVHQMFLDRHKGQ
jgi:hypothetical protein